MGLAKIESGEGQQKTKPLPGINVTMSMFFDGTGNNKNNTDARNAHTKTYEKNTSSSGSSYENDYSNVARLWTNFIDNPGKYVFKYYVEGIGTNDLGKDSSKGNATGSGDTGVPARVKKACKWMADKLTNLAKSKNTKVIDNLIVDAFGFSRGSAAARHFIYEITKAGYKAQVINTYLPGGEFAPGETLTSYKDDMHNDTDFTEFPMRGYLGAYAKQNQLQINNVVIRFAGLFDCVASYNHDFFLPDAGTDTPNQFKKNTPELHLNSVALARRTVHLTAADEHRGNFPLTTIASAGNKGLTFSLPGVHSDVGGCYVDNMNEVETAIDIGTDTDLEAEKKKLVAQGWYANSELTADPYSNSSGLLLYQLSGNRKSVRNTYSFIPLHFMCRHAIEFTQKNTPDNVIPFDQDKIENRSSKTTIIGDKVLEAVNTVLEKQVFSNGPALTHNPPTTAQSHGNTTDTANQQNLLLLRHGYLHWNSNYDTILEVLHPMFPRLVNNHTERLIIPG